MGLVANEKASRTPAPAGTHLANCFGLIDLGTQTSNFNNEVKAAHKVWIWWELCHEKQDDGRPVTVGSFYSVSLHEKATLRAVLQAWRGKPFTPEELKAFQLRNVVGAPCMLTIVHEPKKAGGGVSDKVKAVSGLPKGMTREPVVTPTVVLDLDQFDRATFDGLPNFLKDTIGKSPEGRALGLGTGNGQPTNRPNRPPVEDWDVQGRPIYRTEEGKAEPDIPF